MRHTSFVNSIALAVAVVSGAIAWSVVLCTALKLGCKNFCAACLADGDAGAERAGDALFRGALAWQFLSVLRHSVESVEGRLVDSPKNAGHFGPDAMSDRCEEKR